MEQTGRLQNIFMESFEVGLTGNQLLQRILGRAGEEGIGNAKVYSHSLGHFLHEPGPLIGLPWEQECCVGRGDVCLDYGQAFTMELSSGGQLPEWGEKEIQFAMEQDVIFTREGCRPIDGRQTEFHLV